MFNEVGRSPAIDKAPARGNEAPGIPCGFRNRRLLPALVSNSAPQRLSAVARLPVGIIFYLASITLVATATIGVFFGMGFFLLMGSAEGMIPSDAGARTSDLSPPSFGAPSRSLGRPTAPEVNLTPAAVEVGVPEPAAVAALPAALLPPPSIPNQQRTPDKSEAGPPTSVLDQSAGASQDAPSVSNRQTGLGSQRGRGGASRPADRPGRTDALSSRCGSRAASPSLVLSAEEIGELLTRGDTFLRRGDVTSARLFYERTADAGSGEGATRMGATFDPIFLGRAGLGSTRGDPAKAQSWYRQAIDLSRAESKQGPNARETR
jgi:hypothetical protein